MKVVRNGGKKETPEDIFNGAFLSKRSAPSQPDGITLKRHKTELISGVTEPSGGSIVNLNSRTVGLYFFTLTV